MIYAHNAIATPESTIVIIDAVITAVSDSNSVGQGQSSTWASVVPTTISSVVTIDELRAFLVEIIRSSRSTLAHCIGRQTNQ
jgi:hypothetical protein